MRIITICVSGLKLIRYLKDNTMHKLISAAPVSNQLQFTLEKLSHGESGSVMAINVDGELKKRFFALGLREGARVQVLRKAQFGGPMHLRVGTGELILRLKEASCICLVASPAHVV